MVAVIEVGGKFKRLNPKWSEVLGWTQQELLETPYRQLIHAHDVEKTLPLGFVPGLFHIALHYKALISKAFSSFVPIVFQTLFHRFFFCSNVPFS